MSNLTLHAGKIDRSAYILGRLRALNWKLRSLKLPHLPIGYPTGYETSHHGTYVSKDNDDSMHPDGFPIRDFFIELADQYQAPRLPLHVDLISHSYYGKSLGYLWNYQARNGVRVHHMFDSHDDFVQLEYQSLLASKIKEIIEAADLRLSG